MAEEDYLTEAQLNRLIEKVLAEQGIKSVSELIAWFEDGRRELLRDPAAAARELGVEKWFMHSVIAARAFRQAYFMHIFHKKFDPFALEAGMQMLVEDFISNRTRPTQRLAIFRAIQELFGIFPKQVVEHNVNTRQVNVNLHIVATPEDFKDGGDKVPVRVVGQLGDGAEAESRRLAQEVESVEAEYEEVR